MEKSVADLLQPAADVDPLTSDAPKATADLINYVLYSYKTKNGHTKLSSKNLVFGDDVTNYNPQMGVNNGPFQATPYTDIQIMFIYAKDDLEVARKLLIYLKDGYKNFFKGVKQYTGRDITFAPKDLHLQFDNKQNPITEIATFLFNAERSGTLGEIITAIARRIYLLSNVSAALFTPFAEASKVIFPVCSVV